MVDGWYSMIKVLLLGLVLIAGTQQPKTEFKAMDEFFDKLLQNATPIDKSLFENKELSFRQIKVERESNVDLF